MDHGAAAVGAGWEKEDPFESLCADLCSALWRRLTEEHRLALRELRRRSGGALLRDEYAPKDAALVRDEHDVGASFDTACVVVQACPGKLFEQKPSLTQSPAPSAVRLRDETVEGDLEDSGVSRRFTACEVAAPGNLVGTGGAAAANLQEAAEKCFARGGSISLRQSEGKSRRRLGGEPSGQPPKVCEAMDAQTAAPAGILTVGLSDGDRSTASPRRISPRRLARQVAGDFTSEVSMVTEAERNFKDKAGSMSTFDDDVSDNELESPASGRTLYLGLKRRIQRAVISSAFEIVFSIAILTNSCFLGVEVEHAVVNPTSEQPTVFYVVGHAYNFIFLLELSLRMFAYGSKFLFGVHWGWNWLDLFIVSASMVEFVSDMIYLSGDESSRTSQNLNNVRLLRMTRVAKMVRILRVARILKFFRALRALVYQILATVKSVFWALVLMMVIIYVFAIIFVQTVSDFMQENQGGDYRLLKQYWGTLPRTMYTLYKSVTSGVDWEVVVNPLADVHWAVVALFLTFISFIMFAVLNTVTGVFCQKAIESANHDHDTLIRDQMTEKSMYMKKIRELFQEIDRDSASCITYHQFQSHMRDERMLAYFAIMGLDHTDAWDLFKLLDADRNALVDLEEFVGGFMKLRGTAKSIDIAKLSYENKQMRARLAEFMYDVETLLGQLLERGGLGLPVLANTADCTVAPGQGDEEPPQGCLRV